MKVILSTGQGRLHLVQSAEHIAKQGVDIDLIQGWVPTHPDSSLVRLYSKLSGHKNLAAGLAKRRPSGFSGNIRSCAAAELAHQLLAIVSRKTDFLPESTSTRWGWKLFGFQSRIYLHGGSVFHVRSGAGQGGAIADAKRQGMKVIVDQSALHPDVMKSNTQRDLDRWNIPSTFGSDYGVWKLVLEDCRAADMLLVNSEQVKKSFVENGWDEQKIAVAYLGVRDDFLGIKQNYSTVGPLTLLFTGGFSVLKGAEYIFEMMKTLKERRIECVMNVVGSTESAQTLIDFYRNENLAINFMGHVPQDALKKYLSEADIYVFPSLADGCASSAMEAMAAGLCVVATAESGIPLIDGETGFLVPSKNGAALADRVEWLAGRREQIAVVGRVAAKNIRENYTWEKYAKTVAAIYAALESQR